jgi:RecA/RadA recombinase
MGMGHETETMAGVIHLFLVTKMMTARMGTTKTTTTTTKTTTTTVASVFYNLCVFSRQELMFEATKKTTRRRRFI